MSFNHRKSNTTKTDGGYPLSVTKKGRRKSWDIMMKKCEKQGFKRGIQCEILHPPTPSGLLSNISDKVRLILSLFTV